MPPSPPTPFVTFLVGMLGEEGAHKFIEILAHKVQFPQTKIGRAIILWGPSRCGKTVLINLLKRIELPRYVVTNDRGILNTLRERGSRHTQPRAPEHEVSLLAVDGASSPQNARRARQLASFIDENTCNCDILFATSEERVARAFESALGEHRVLVLACKTPAPTSSTMEERDAPLEHMDGEAILKYLSEPTPLVRMPQSVRRRLREFVLCFNRYIHVHGLPIHGELRNHVICQVALIVAKDEGFSISVL